MKYSERDSYEQKNIFCFTLRIKHIYRSINLYPEIWCTVS